MEADLNHSASPENPHHLLVVSEHVDATENSTGYYWSKIVQGMLERNWKVSVVSTANSCAKAAERNPGAAYLPTRETKYRRESLVGRALGQLLLSMRLTASLLRHVSRRSIVFTGTNPSLALPLLAAARQLCGFRWVLLVHDVFPENALAAGLLRGDSLRFKAAKWIFDWSYRRPDALISIGRDMTELLQEKTGGRANVHYVPNWVDIESAPRRVEPESTARRKVKFQFFGNLGRVQGIDVLLNAIGIANTDEAVFEFVGNGAMLELINGFAAANPHIDIRHRGSVPMQRNGEVLTDCDVAIVSLSAGMRGLGVPSKAYFSMAADKPLLVIADEGSELHAMVNERPSIGWFAKAGDVEDIAAKISAISTHGVGDSGRFSREVIATSYSQKVALRRIAEVLVRPGAAAKPAERLTS